MAGIPVTLVGVAYTDKSMNATPVTIVCDLSYQGLGIGGGPMPGGRPPLGIWGPDDPRPGTGLPGNQPGIDNTLPGNQPYPGQGLPGNQPGIDNTLPGQQPRPGWPPIAMPPIFYPPTEPPVGEPGDDGFVKPPPEGGGWAYHEDFGWLFSPSGSAGGKPQPGPGGPSAKP
jgi:hypothetical protein